MAGEDFIEGEIRSTEKGWGEFSVSAVVLQVVESDIRYRLSFPQIYSPSFLAKGDQITVDYREESGGSKDSPRIVVNRQGLGNNPLYASNLPAKCISRL